MQKISHDEVPQVSKVTKGVSRYRQNTRVKPTMASSIKGKQFKSGDRLSVCGNFTINKKS